MSKSGNIEHSGVINEISDDVIRVKIDVYTACSACRANRICGVDSQSKIIEVRHWNETYATGDHVNVILKENLGLKALFLAYLGPFLLMVPVLLLMMAFTGKEGLSALVSIASLIPYFGIIYLNRDKLQKTFNFEICKNENYL